jgi:hypothetical protein
MSPISRPYSGRPTRDGVELERWLPEVVEAAARLAREVAVHPALLDDAPVEDIVAAVEAAGLLRQVAERAEARALLAARSGPAPLSWDRITRAAGYPVRSTAQRRHASAPETLRSNSTFQDVTTR